MALTITETRPCGHEVGGYPLEAARLKDPCPVCGKSATAILFKVQEEGAVPVAPPVSTAPAKPVRRRTARKK